MDENDGDRQKDVGANKWGSENGGKLQVAEEDVVFLYNEQPAPAWPVPPSPPPPLPPPPLLPNAPASAPAAPAAPATVAAVADAVAGALGLVPNVALPETDLADQHRKAAELERQIVTHEASMTLRTLAFLSASQRLACLQGHVYVEQEPEPHSALGESDREPEVIVLTD
jgi:hypothetical protein